MTRLARYAGYGVIATSLGGTGCPCVCTIGPGHDPPQTTDSADTADGETAQTADTGETATVPCTEDDAFFSGVTVEETGVPVVFRVRWDTTTPSRGSVRFSSGGLSYATPPDAEAGTSHSALLVGLEPAGSVSYQAVGTTDALERCTTPRTEAVPPLPSSFPTVSLVQADTSRSTPGFVATILYAPPAAYAIVLDALGRIAWYYPVTPWATKAAFSLDRRSILYNDRALGDSSDGSVRMIGLDGVPGRTAWATGAHTDFVERADGTLAVLGWEVRTYEYGGETRKILGDTVEEIAPDGTVRVIWNIFDHVTPDLSVAYQKNGFYTEDLDVEDWSHVNSLSYDAATDRYLVTIQVLDGFAAIDCATGAMDWVFGPDSDDFTFPTDPTLVSWPHSVQALGDDRYLVFNRRVEVDACSNVTEIALEPTTGAAALAWSWQPSDCLTVTALGQAQRLDDGNTFVIWSSAGRMDEVTADGTSVWQVSAPFGAAFGFGDGGVDLY